MLNTISDFITMYGTQALILIGTVFVLALIGIYFIILGTANAIGWMLSKML